MRSNKRRDTKPERRLASELHSRGLRFRRDYYVRTETSGAHLDIAFPARRIYVQCLGCFWHQCPLHATRPKRNAEYWDAKLDSNVERDRRVRDAMSAAGWNGFWVWEHEAADQVADRIEAVVRATPARRG